MRKRRISNFKFRISNFRPHPAGLVLLGILVFCFRTDVFSQKKIAVVTPGKNAAAGAFAEKLEAGLSGEFKVLDGSLAAAAYRSSVFERPFNLTTQEARNIGAAIGAHYFLLVGAAVERRSAFGREEFYEAHAAVYVVSAKTGKLVFWNLDSFDANAAAEAEAKLLGAAGKLAARVSARIGESEKSETRPAQKNSIEEVPAENAPEAKNFRPPLPYRRISPQYTPLADYYNVRATVDILVDIGGDGKILDTQIVRWAGYGLDESVAEAVRRMNWRPAERGGKFLPMRILLRYNFKDIEDEGGKN